MALETHILASSRDCTPPFQTSQRVRTNNMSFNRVQRFIITAVFVTMAITLMPAAAFAHMGVGPVHDMLHGFAHPLTGLDHILATFAVGLWAAQRGGRELWLLPLIFAVSMTIGIAIGFAAGPMPYVEPAIALSVIVLGLLIATTVRLPDAVGAAIVCAFALCHGHAHGTEIPATAYGFAYAFGFLPATAILLAAGIAFGSLSQRLHTR